MDDSSDSRQEQFTVLPEEARTRLDVLVCRHSPNCSRSRSKELIENGCVVVDGQKQSPSYAVRSGQVISVDWPAPEPAGPSAEDIPLDIIYEDEDMIVINKPAGLVVHPGAGQKSGTLVNALLNYDADSFGDMAGDDDDRPGIVHRLDGDTSGVMVVARRNETLEKMKASFIAHQVHKTYLAIVHGTFDCLAGMIEKPIGRNPRQRQKMAVVSTGGKYALTNYRVLACGDKASLLAVRIMTGRTHQIRVHMAYLGHPVVGDRTYGGVRPWKDHRMPERQMLHAWKLELPHPVRGDIMTFSAPLTPDFLDCLRDLQLDGNLKDS